MKPGTLFPSLPTRERRAYRAAARMYADAFRIVFPDPFTARRLFRCRVGLAGFGVATDELWKEHEKADALSPRVAQATVDAAFLYWTHRERRPRRYLVAIAEAIRAEFHCREYMDREGRVRGEYGHALGWLRDATEARARSLPEARAFLREAGEIYRQPGQACRAMIRHARRGDAYTTAVTLRERPETFGKLRTAFRWIVVPTADAAKERAAELARSFRQLAETYPKRRRVEVRRLQAEFNAAAAGVQAVEVWPRPKGGDVREAARLLAVLYRRRDVDERPAGKGPPSISRQLAALLPEGARPLLREVMRAAVRGSGEDPVRSHHHGSSLEVELGLRGAREPGREHGRGSGGLAF
jgi:hypothetical protein